MFVVRDRNNCGTSLWNRINKLFHIDMKVFNNHDQPDENNCKCLVCLLKKCSIGWKKPIWSYGIGACPAVKYYRCAQIVQLRRKRAKIEGMTKLRQIAFRSGVFVWITNKISKVIKSSQRPSPSVPFMSFYPDLIQI